MARKQLNVRLPQITIDQIAELVDYLPAESQAHVIMIAVDRLHQQENEMFKKIKEVLSGGELYAEDKSGYAVISKSDLEIDERGEVYGGDITIRYGQGMMPPHHRKKVNEKDIEKVMRDYQKDLRKWRRPENE